MEAGTGQTESFPFPQQMPVEGRERRRPKTGLIEACSCVNRKIATIFNSLTSVKKINKILH